MKKTLSTKKKDTKKGESHKFHKDVEMKDEEKERHREKSKKKTLAKK